MRYMAVNSLKKVTEMRPGGGLGTSPLEQGRLCVFSRADERGE